MTHDHKRHGTTTLFAALNMFDRQVIGQCQPRRTHAKWPKFQRRINRTLPKDKALHLIADNHVAHGHTKSPSPEMASYDTPHRASATAAGRYLRAVGCRFLLFVQALPVDATLCRGIGQPACVIDVIAAVHTQTVLAF